MASFKDAGVFKVVTFDYWTANKGPTCRTWPYNLHSKTSASSNHSAAVGSDTSLLLGAVRFCTGNHVDLFI